MLGTLYEATRMVVKLQKSSVYLPNTTNHVRVSLSNILSLQALDLKGGLCYLGYKLKLNNYGTSN